MLCFVKACKLIGVPFSLIVDKSTDCSVIKYLCICVKYFDTTRVEISTEFLSFLEVECVTADSLFEVVKSFIKNLGLNLVHLVDIKTDSASNFCGKNHSLLYCKKSVQIFNLLEAFATLLTVLLRMLPKNCLSLWLFYVVKYTTDLVEVLAGKFNTDVYLIV